MAPTQTTDSEDPELDFTNYMEKQNAALNATTPFAKPPEDQKKPMPAVLIRGIVFFMILLALLGVLIFLYMSRPEGGKIIAPEGFKVIDDGKTPPRLERN